MTQNQLYLYSMSLDKEPTVTDALEAIRALREELASVKDELVGCKSEVSRLNRNNTHLVVKSQKPQGKSDTPYGRGREARWQ